MDGMGNYVSDIWLAIFGVVGLIILLFIVCFFVSFVVALFSTMKNNRNLKKLGKNARRQPPQG